MHWEPYGIKIKIALAGSACSIPLSTIRSHICLQATLEGLWVR
jgi:hypothetical protein